MTQNLIRTIAIGIAAWTVAGILIVHEYNRRERAQDRLLEICRTLWISDCDRLFPNEQNKGRLP